MPNKLEELYIAFVREIAQLYPVKDVIGKHIETLEDIIVEAHGLHEQLIKGGYGK